MVQKCRDVVFILIFFLFIAVVTPPESQAAPPAQEPLGASDQQLLDQLKQAAGGTVRISYHDETGRVNFIGARPDRSINQPSVLGVAPSAEDAARGFLKGYGKLFGVRNPDSELTVLQEQTGSDGRAFVRFQQTYRGIPIVGGGLIVQSGRGGDIISANGEALSDVDINTTPNVTAKTARQTALAVIAKGHQVDIDKLQATEPELWIFNPALLGGPGRRVNTLVWRLEITTVELLPIRELVLIDAQLGVVVLNFNQIHAAKNRINYDNANNSAFGLPGNGPVRSEGGAASGITDVDLAYDYAGDTYDFFFNEHGRDSLDNAGMSLISTTRYCPDSGSCPYANAFWNGAQMAYGQGFSAADDVVGHELTHGVTDFSSHLFYYYQSGAINESFSDVWGEFIDQINGSGTDTAAVKWLMGEDIPGIGAIRNMANPPAANDPDKISSSFYYCGESDSGGVHTNSGVNNKAVYLLTDGGDFNDKTVTGLGISKVADLYYEAQTTMLTSGSNYNDLYNALIQAGINLGYSAGDQQEIKDALDAVEMNQRPCSGPAQATICPATWTPDYIFVDDMENPGSGNWTSAALSGVNRWYYPQTTNPYGFDATYTSSGVYNLWGYNQANTADYHIAMTTDILLPANAYLYFKHDWAFEDWASSAYDGGVVEYSTNGGGVWNDAGSLFDTNGYNGAIVNGFGNPLAGRSAFTSESQGYTASRLNLNSLAGENVRFRFRIGTDSVISALGWFIDDVQIYTCQPNFKLDPANNVYLPLVVKGD